MYASKVCNLSIFMEQLMWLSRTLLLAAGSRGLDGLHGLVWPHHCSSCLHTRGENWKLHSCCRLYQTLALTHLLRQCCWTEAAVGKLRVILSFPHSLYSPFALIAQHHVRTLVRHH